MNIAQKIADITNSSRPLEQLSPEQAEQLARAEALAQLSQIAGVAEQASDIWREQYAAVLAVRAAASELREHSRG